MARARPATLRRASVRLAPLVGLALLTGWVGSTQVGAAEHSGGDGAAEKVPAVLRFSEALYRAGDSYRSETELLRWLHAHRRDPWRGRAELARAKLYHRAGRYNESTIMLLSLLDRTPNDPARRQAEGLLALALARQDRLHEAASHLWALERGGATPRLEGLQGAASGEVDPARAVAWSTWLPGSGFFLVDRPAQAAAGLSLNLAFTAGAIVAWQQDNIGAALVLLLAEVALYRGGREAARDAALHHNQRLRAERLEHWAREAGEPELLRVGLTVNF